MVLSRGESTVRHQWIHMYIFWIKANIFRRSVNIYMGNELKEQKDRV